MLPAGCVSLSPGAAVLPAGALSLSPVAAGLPAGAPPSLGAVLPAADVPWPRICLLASILARVSHGTPRMANTNCVSYRLSSSSLLTVLALMTPTRVPRMCSSLFSALPK